MMVMLFACRVVSLDSSFTALKGTREFIPVTLRQRVADIVINDFTLPELVPVEFGGTMVTTAAKV